MQPCSQPRYGLILNSKPTSGLLFRAMIFFVVSRKTMVGGGGSSGSYASMSGTYSIGSNRLAGFSAAPRPLIVTRLGASIVLLTAEIYRGKRGKRGTIPLSTVPSPASFFF